MNERRRKLVPVTRLFATDMLWHTGTIVHIKCAEGLPEDASFIGLTYDHMRDVYYFCYQSSEWEEVPEGEMLPVFMPTFINLYVAPLLEQAAELVEDYVIDAPTANKWLEAYRAFKEQTGYPNGD